MSQSQLETARLPSLSSEQGPTSAANDSFEAIVQEVTDYCIFLLDPAGVVVSWNRGAEMVKGYTGEEIIGSHFSRFYPPDDLSAGKPEHALDEATRKGRYEDEGWRVRKDGSCFWADVVITALHDPDGSVRGFAKVTRDMTAQRHSFQELQRSNAEFAEFAHVVAHDLQEPLRTMSSYIQLLQRRYQGELGDEADEYIGFAVDGATRMHGLIADLLDYSRVGSRPMEMSTVNVDAVLDATTANLRAAIDEAGAHIVRGELPEVQADFNQITQLFQNLISNSLKFHGVAAPRIAVTALQEDANWLFSVSDNGIGIPADQVERIFGVFKRLHTREEYAGSGIGLTTCRKVVERHGGRIWAESTPGEGSTFYFTLPRPRARQPQ